MRCIYCNRDNKYKERTSGRCYYCRHAFAFEPKNSRYKMTDRFFLRLIEVVTGDYRLYCTERQLWYEFSRRLWRRRSWRPEVVGIVVGVLCLCGTLFIGPERLITGASLAVLAIFLGFLVRFYSRRRPPQVLVNFGDFRRYYLQRWVEVHGQIKRLLPVSNERLNSPTNGGEPDLTAYSFDRVLVTDKKETAEMLIANNVHVECKCAILSVDGYPPTLTETMLTMLQRNPQLKVFALHGATVKGCALPLVLRKKEWFPDPSIPIIDFALRPQQVKNLRLFTLSGPSGTLHPALKRRLTPDEAQWLERGNMSEIDNLRPGNLMWAISRGFARTAQSGLVNDKDSEGVFALVLEVLADLIRSVFTRSNDNDDLFEADENAHKNQMDIFLDSDFG